MLESWGAENIDGFTKYKELNVTPYFKSLADKSLKYTNFYANGHRSIYGITSIYTGVTLPQSSPYLGSGLELSALSYLGNIAKQNGYHTLAMQSSNKRSYRVDAVSNLAGFKEYYGAEDMKNVEVVEEGRRPNTGTFDYNMFDFMHSRLNTIDSPFFAFMFTNTNHSDYHLSHSKFERYPHNLAGYEGYLNSLIYVDNAIERFMVQVKDESWFDDTIFIFTSDHGSHDALGEVGISLRGGDDRRLPLVEHFRVPLIIHAPKIFKPETIDTLGSQNDIMPTIIDLLGFKQEFSALGNSLFDSSANGRFVYINGGNNFIYMKDECFISHNRKSIVGSNCDKSQLEHMEQEYKAVDTIQSQLLQRNRWAR